MQFLFQFTCWPSWLEDAVFACYCVLYLATQVTVKWAVGMIRGLNTNRFLFQNKQFKDEHTG